MAKAKKHKVVKDLDKKITILAVMIVAGLIGAYTLGFSFAAKGGNGGGGNKGGRPDKSVTSLSVVMVEDGNLDGLPNHGDKITFDFDRTVAEKPYLDLTCSRNEAVVLGATTGYFDGYPWPWTQEITLTSGAWQAGEADCSADLYTFGKQSRKSILATLDFKVYE